VRRLVGSHSSSSSSSPAAAAALASTASLASGASKRASSTSLAAGVATATAAQQQQQQRRVSNGSLPAVGGSSTVGLQAVSFVPPQILQHLESASSDKVIGTPPSLRAMGFQ
jgi:hypothetical protein